MDKKIISFATDFGLSDGSVGVVKGVINRIDPELKVLDISHNINPQDIRGGSLLLMRAIQYLLDKFQSCLLLIGTLHPVNI